MSQTNWKTTFAVAILVAWYGNSSWAQNESNGRTIDEGKYYQATIAAAEKSLRLGDVGSARRWLEACPSDQRGWEWSHLHWQLDESTSTIPLNSDEITAFAVSHDGRWLATADTSGKIELRSTDDVQDVRQIGDHNAAVYSIAFSPDGNHLASVSRDVTSRVWEIHSGKELSRISLENPGVAATTFSPDGKQVATCSWMMEREPRAVHGMIWIWDSMTGELKHRQKIGIKPLDSIAWSHDGETIAVGSWDGYVHLLDRSGTEYRRLSVPNEGLYTAVISVCLNRDSTLVAAGSKDHTARIWDVKSGRLLHTLRNHNGYVNDLAFSPQADALATACEDSIVRLWDLQDPRLVPKTLLGHRRSVGSVAWPAKGRPIYTIARDQTMRTWDAEKSFGGKLSFQAETTGTYSAAFSPDGDRIHAATHTGMVQIHDAKTGETITAFHAHPDSTCNFLSIDDSGTRILTCSWDKTAKLWAVPEQKLLHEFPAGQGVYHCALSPDGKLALLAAGKTAQVWNCVDGSQVGQLQGHTADVKQVVFSPDGSLLATASDDQSIGIWNTTTLKQERLLQGHESGVSAVCFSADGVSLATADRNGNVRIWNGPEWRETNHIRVGDRTIFRLAYSPDSKRLAVASHGVYIVDPQANEPLLWLNPVNDTVWFTSFSPAGDSLVSSSTGGQIAINGAGKQSTLQQTK